MSALIPQPAAEEIEEAPLPETPPGPPQRRGFLAWFILAWFGITLAGSALSGAAIPKAFAFLDDATKAQNLSIVTAIGGVVVIVITPLFGRLSDRTTSRAGMRRPWMIGGAAVGLVGVLILTFTEGLWATVLGWSVAQIGLGATNMAIHALLADQIPRRLRARIAGAASAAGGIALVAAGYLVAALPNDARWSWFLVPGVLGTVLTLGLWATLRDIVRTEPAPRLRPRDVLSTYWLNPIRYRDFFWAFACRLLVTMSIFSIATYLLFFVIDRLGVPKETASGVAATAIAVYTVTNIVTTVVFGWISDRTGRRKPIVWISCILSAAGLTVAMFATAQPLFLVAMALVGAAQGAYVSVDIALMTEVLPSFREAGKDLGIVSLSYQLPQFLVPIVALPLLAIPPGQNYTALFAAAIVFAALGGLAVLPIKKAR